MGSAINASLATAFGITGVNYGITSTCGASVHEAIYSLLMQQGSFITPSSNIANLDPDAEGYPIVHERRDNVSLPLVMSNSFGFGGTNASLVFRKKLPTREQTGKGLVFCLEAFIKRVATHAQLGRDRLDPYPPGHHESEAPRRSSKRSKVASRFTALAPFSKN